MKYNVWTESGYIKYSDDELHAAGYIKHHTATRRGYQCVDEESTIQPYCGRFGRGYIKKDGRKTNQYQYITYWIAGENAKPLKVRK